MALPKEPRQKMINIMYLVLTALLALNVSAEILNAFKTVERSLTATNKTINTSTETLMESFVELKGDPRTAEKANYWEPKAIMARQHSKEVNDYIEGLKKEIMAAAGFDPLKNGDSSFKEDNQEVATRLLVEEKKGQELRAKLEQYKKNMVAIDPTLAKDIENYMKQIDLSTPPTRNKANTSWE